MVYVNRRRDKLLEEEIYSITQMYAEGFSQNYIANKFHVDRSTIRYHLDRTGTYHVVKIDYSTQESLDKVIVNITIETLDHTARLESGRKIDWSNFERRDVSVTQEELGDVTPGLGRFITRVKRHVKPKKYIDYVIEQYKREKKVVPTNLLRRYGRKKM